MTPASPLRVVTDHAQPDRPEPRTADLCRRAEEAAAAHARVLECELSAKMAELMALAHDIASCRSARPGARNIGLQVVTKLEAEHGALRALIERGAGW